MWKACKIETVSLLPLKTPHTEKAKHLKMRFYYPLKKSKLIENTWLEKIIGPFFVENENSLLKHL